MMGLGFLQYLLWKKTCKNTSSNCFQLDHNHLKQLGPFSQDTYQNLNIKAMVTELYETCDDLISDLKFKLELSKWIAPTRRLGEQQRNNTSPLCFRS